MATSSSSVVVSAADLAPAAFNRAPAQSAGTAGRTDDLVYDLGHLMACDTHPFDAEGAAHAPEGAEAFLRAQSRGNVQLLLNRVFNLPQTRTDQGTLAVELPAPTTTLPREKPAPKPRVATTWEKFAQKKGISSRKKSRMVHDDQKDEWRPRWGYQKADDVSKDWLIELKGNDADDHDAYAALRQQKTEQLLKNKRKQLGNLERRIGSAGAGIPTAASGLYDSGKGAEFGGRGAGKGGARGGAGAGGAAKGKGARKGKRAVGLGADGTSQALHVAQRSTASLGKFDRQLLGEKKDLKKGKKRRRPSAMASTTDRDAGIMERLLKRGPSGKHVADPGRAKKVYGGGEDGLQRKKKKGKALGKNRRPPTR